MIVIGICDDDLQFIEQLHEIIDFSSNGTFVNRDLRLIRDEKYTLKPGTEICFGDKSTVYKLG